MSLAEACLLAAELENFNDRIIAEVYNIHTPGDGYICAILPSGSRWFRSEAEVRNYIDN